MTSKHRVAGVVSTGWATVGATALILGACSSRVDLGGASGATTGTGGSDGGTPTAGTSGDAGDAGEAGAPSFPQQTSNKLDLLFVVDNSISMADKQQILQESFVDLVGRLTNPLCVDAGGSPSVGQPTSPDGACPTGYEREFAPVTDLHVGIVSSSLGGHGADICSPAGPGWNATQDDHGRLIGSVRSGVISYNNSGFLKYDPRGQASPPGESDAQTFLQRLKDMVAVVGETGCGFEAPLEALYRFLVDPEPPLEIVNVNNTAVPQGVDNEVLAQRLAFLRPDSAVLGVVLSDENDCSILDGGIGWLAAQGSNAASAFHLPRATSACASDPNDPCCQSCGSTEPAAGCAPLESDPQCNMGMYDDVGDALNLRCWDQKRRFGLDFLYPIQRYVDGFTKTTITDRNGQQQPNPLFAAGGRNPSLVSIGMIVGVPWQDIARDPNGARLELLTAAELNALGRWNVILGAPASYVPAEDPLMVESVEPRSGVSPIIGVPLAPPTSTDPTAAPNGHEYNIPQRNDLQYACIFPLAQARDCMVAVGGCDCQQPDMSANKPLCSPPGGGPAGTTQYFAKAYPGLRELDVAKRMGERSFVASVCPKSIDPAAADFGYRPAFDAMMARLRRMLE